jgi:undecaprenyl-diphosphatase
MAGASLLKVVKFLSENGMFSGQEIVVLLTGCIVAFLVSFVVIKFFMDYIKRHDFKIFGWYRIIVGIIVLAYFTLR